MLGHSSVTITLDLYGDVTPTMLQQAVGVLDSLLSAPVAVNLAVNGDPSEHHGPGPALVAQGIEHRFPKPCVAGSNPAEGATENRL
jgi:hypothetical protein